MEVFARSLEEFSDGKRALEIAYWRVYPVLFSTTYSHFITSTAHESRICRDALNTKCMRIDEIYHPSVYIPKPWN
jgi:predicted HAD superfamily phosphohydrolase